MSIQFKIIDKQNINSIIPLVQKLNGNRDTDAVLEERFSEMITQNYECAGIFDNEKLIGICGLWFCTRHYSGKSVEPDHVFIDDDFFKSCEIFKFKNIDKLKHKFFQRKIEAF